MKKGCGWLLVLLAMGTFCGFLASAVWTYVMPKKYESEAVIELKPRLVGASFIGPGNDSSNPAMRMTPQFFATEFEKIKSRKAMEMVVEKLALTNRWNVDKEESIRILKGMVTIQNIRGTDLISIRARHPNKDDARDIAEAVTLAYRDYRNETERRDEENALLELNKAVRAQEDKVEEQRKLLATIVNIKGIIYKGQDSFYNPGGIDEKQDAKNVLQEFEKLEAERLRLKTQIESLLKYDADNLLVYAAGVPFPDNPVSALLPKYQEGQRKLEEMKQPSSGMGGDHPAVVAAEKQLEAMKRELDEGVVNLRASLTAQLALAESRLKEVEKQKNRIREEAIKRGLDTQDYVDAKRDFETELALLQELKLKKVTADIGGHIPFQSVEIHDEPEVSDAPVSPNVTLNLVLGALAGFVLFPIAGLLVMGGMKLCAAPKQA